MGKIEVRNATSPGHVTRVDAAKYNDMKQAVLAVLPSGPPGMTPKDLIAGAKAHLSPALFPGGEKAGWWMKCVQLDLEFKGEIRRAEKAPVRLWRV
jgi:hypothetical protein